MGRGFSEILHYILSSEPHAWQGKSYHGYRSIKQLDFTLPTFALMCTQKQLALLQPYTTRSHVIKPWQIWRFYLVEYKEEV
jgi:hypothetical protein